MTHLSFEDYVTLNALCNVYHSGFGYDREDALLDEPNSLSTLKTQFDWIEEVENPDDDTEVTYKLDTKKAKECAINYHLGHDRIVIRLRNEGKSGWRSKPDNVVRTYFDKSDIVTTPVPWYELPKRSFKKKEFEGPFSDRHYMQVIDFYDEVAISKNIKGSDITIDDILFASRALCIGADRCVFSYAVLYDDGKTLKLKADIDNWST